MAHCILSYRNHFETQQQQKHHFVEKNTREEKCDMLSAGTEPHTYIQTNKLYIYFARGTVPFDRGEGLVYTYRNKTKDNIDRGWVTCKQIHNLCGQDTGSQRKIH